MLARMVMIQGKPEMIDEAARYFKEETLTNAKKIQGFKRGFMMVNRQTGQIVAMVHWENQQAIQDSSSLANRAITEMARRVGATQAPMIEVYEVAVAEVPSPVGTR